jgi:hypothetical protein
MAIKPTRLIGLAARRRYLLRQIASRNLTSQPSNPTPTVTDTIVPTTLTPHTHKISSTRPKPRINPNMPSIAPILVRLLLYPLFPTLQQSLNPPPYPRRAQLCRTPGVRKHDMQQRVRGGEQCRAEVGEQGVGGGGRD